jgi:hypothetical protein
MEISVMMIVKNEEDSALNKPEASEEQQPKEKEQFTLYRSIDHYGEELLQSTNRHVVDFLS